MALKKPKLDRQTLLSRRYSFMREAFKIDGGRCQSPFHGAVVKEFDKTKHYNLLVMDVHHLHNRTNTGEFDTLEYIITLCRLEHDFCENGTAKMAGKEYEYKILWHSRTRPTNRWNKPRELLEKQITPERLKYIRGIK